MYFRNYGLPKTWLDLYQKSIDSEYPWTSNMVNTPTHCRNVNSSTLITVIVIEFEKVALSYMENLRTVCWHLNCLWKVFFLNREHLTQPNHMQLFIKTTNFFQFFSAILATRLSFQYFQKKITLIANVFSK